MFTGIIKAVGVVTDITSKAGDICMSIRPPKPSYRDIRLGESIAVNGVCLTAVTVSKNGFNVDISRETLTTTTLYSLKVGSHVNIEPALTVGDSISGHFVTGHVDCIGKVILKKPDARSTYLRISFPSRFLKYIAPKGSICIDGVSLTVNEVSGNEFTVNIIPHTTDVTILDGYQVGTEVNIEIDLIARYLEHFTSDEKSNTTSKEFLKVHGYG